MSGPSIGKAAEWYGRRGFRVIPLHFITPDGCTCGRSECDSPGKHPLILRWPENASMASNMIAVWWKRWPSANVGLVTGALSGVVVLDVDPRHGGHYSLEQLERKHGDLPATVEAETGSGGRHIFFKHPGTRIPNSAGLLGPGLDVRGDGGYIVAPPSLHSCGRRYTWVPTRHPAHMETSPMPPWLLTRLACPSPAPRQPRANDPIGKLVLGEVREGQRNSSLARLAGHLLSHRLDPGVALGFLRIWNEAKCRPPLPDLELCRTLDSIAGAEEKRRRR
jgi:Bifunctional DNA primase/polymerase, N-terminal/Primase C terminal 1 (PriCT-1)